MQKNGACLGDEAHATIICQVESIINYRPVTVENLNDPKSLSLLTLNHLFTIKTWVLLTPPGTFQSNNKYSTNRWRRIQQMNFRNDGRKNLFKPSKGGQNGTTLAQPSSRRLCPPERRKRNSK